MSKPQRQLTQKEKRSLIQERLKIASELSNKALGRILEVSHHTIQKIRQEMNRLVLLTSRKQAKRTGEYIHI